MNIFKRKERLDKLIKSMNGRLEIDGKLDMRKFVAEFSIDNDVSSRTVKDYIYTLRDAEITYIEGMTIYRSAEVAKKKHEEDEKRTNDALKEYKKLFEKIV